VLDDGVPLFSQIAELLAEEIADGALNEGDRVPSTNELAAYHRINPATAAKGINVLIDNGLLEKRRGIGMFVAAGARAKLLEDRRKQFAARYVEPMVTEAKRIGLGTEALLDLVNASSNASTSNSGTSNGSTSNGSTGNGKGDTQP
jgi:GntR family transcriptional regulator